jgi:hypothetical protein
MLRKTMREMIEAGFSEHPDVQIMKTPVERGIDNVCVSKAAQKYATPSGKNLWFHAFGGSGWSSRLKLVSKDFGRLHAVSRRS